MLASSLSIQASSTSTSILSSGHSLACITPSTLTTLSTSAGTSLRSQSSTSTSCLTGSEQTSSVTIASSSVLTPSRIEKHTILIKPSLHTLTVLFLGVSSQP